MTNADDRRARSRGAGIPPRPRVARPDMDTDYNDPFEQAGEIPVFDWNAAAAARRNRPTEQTDEGRVEDMPAAEGDGAT